ncbi:MAG: tetratricopeptide repeat protein, partial [Desulfobacteraceae bacterium]|nr:tetratricopeptide repeat protein [Desulfobacteraceae bacterium]
FPEPGMLKDYCRTNKPFSDIRELGNRENVRFWLQGQYQQKGEDFFLSLVLHDTKEGMSEFKICFSMALNDGLLECRAKFFEWLETCGHPFVGIENASWPEYITGRGLDFLGRALETTYINYIQGDGPGTNLIDLSWFDRAVDESEDSYLAHDLRGWGLYKNGEYKMAEKAFASALNLNPDGLGALSGMMWCALCAKNREKTLEYALAKATCRNQDHKKARIFVDKKFENLS